MTDEIELRELLRNVAAAQMLTGSTPGLRNAAALQEARQAEEEAPRWFDGKPARRVLGYLGPMERAARAAPVDAAGELLVALAEDDCASLLVLHPVLPAETLAAYARRCEGAPGWGLAWHERHRPGGTLPQRLRVKPAQSGAGRFRLNLGPTPLEKAASGAAAWLADFWHERLQAGRVDDLDRPPGLPPGAVLGVLEVDAARLWPVLSLNAAQTVRRLHAVPTADDRAEQWRAACEGCKPPDGFRMPLPGRKRFIWQPEHRAELLRQFEALEAACGKQAPALVELHQRWGYAEPKSDKGGSLTKILSKAREERAAQQPRRSVKGRL